MHTCCPRPPLILPFRGGLTSGRPRPLDAADGRGSFLGRVLLGVVGAESGVVSLYAVLTWLFVVALHLALSTWPARSA
jgi:hypothetical protein